jgi:peptidoglycan/LPS O-acetylase OafA/YrhL
MLTSYNLRMKPHINAHIEPLTALRGIAACFVLLFHYRTHFPALGDVTAFASRGYVWVDLFFALSGYIMATMYHATLADGYRSPAIKRYFWARVARIYPLHLVTLAVMVGMESAFAFAQHAGLMAGNNPAFASAERNAFGILTNALLIQA